jgi:hypothetical protein
MANALSCIETHPLDCVEFLLARPRIIPREGPLASKLIDRQQPLLPYFIGRRRGKMTRKQWLLFPLILLVFCSCLQAQLWNGIIGSGRAVDWSHVGVQGGIPNRTTVCATLNPGATSAQIDSAIASCSSGGVVVLNAGSYTLSGGIHFTGKSNVTLRGAGADQTLITFSGPDGCHGTAADICMDSSDTNWNGGPSNTANWTAGYAKGTTVITLSNTTNLKVGNPLLLDEIDDLTDGGGIYICEESTAIRPAQNPGCSDDDGGSGGDSGAQRGQGTSSPRGQMQIVTVTAINGNQVTISPGLYMPNWNVFSGASPGAWWATSPVLNDGVEDLSMDHTNSGATSGVEMFNCQGCWIRGVRGMNADRNHVMFYFSNKDVVQDSYFYGLKNSASESYGIEAFPSSDSLIQNNIFQKITAPIVINASCSGCVLAYNFSINDFYTPSSTWQSQSQYMHAGGIDNLLLEGNVGVGLYSDLFHGTHHFVTAFRNRYDGFEPNNGTATTDHTNPMLLWPYSRFYNIIGNVLGSTSLPSSIYSFVPGSTGNEDASIFVVGTGTVSCCRSGDPVAVNTLMRWGNYDTVNGAARFVSSEIPSLLSGILGPYGNPIPLLQTLPASFYLSSKPSWFGSVQWPPIGPDVTGGNLPGVGGHAYSIPAENCYSSNMSGVAAGTGNALTFNADNCYGGNTTSTPPPAAPAAPTNLNAVIQ